MLLTKVRTLRSELEKHTQLEENTHFPKQRQALSEQENTELAHAMDNEGLKLA